MEPVLAGPVNLCDEACRTVVGALAWAGPSLLMGLLTAFVLRRRLPGPLVALTLAACGAGLAWGLLLLRPDPTGAEIAAAMVALGLVVPVHVRIVLGPFGPEKRDSGPSGR